MAFVYSISIVFVIFIVVLIILGLNDDSKKTEIKSTITRNSLNPYVVEDVTKLSEELKISKEKAYEFLEKYYVVSRKKTLN